MNPWQAAVLDEAASLFVSEEGTPREILKRVIAANVQIALDPAVSSEAQALIDRGRAQVTGDKSWQMARRLDTKAMREGSLVDPDEKTDNPPGTIKLGDIRG